MLNGLWVMWRRCVYSLLCCAAITTPALAADGTQAQHKAAEELLAALAAGDAFAMAQAIHEDELGLLRKTLVGMVRDGTVEQIIKRHP